MDNTAQSSGIIINPVSAAISGEGEGRGTAAAAAEPCTASGPTGAGGDDPLQAVMGRKKIQIAQIADERNRQVRESHHHRP